MRLFSLSVMEKVLVIDNRVEKLFIKSIEMYTFS